jgi:hypothetical protein
MLLWKQHLGLKKWETFTSQEPKELWIGSLVKVSWLFSKRLLSLLLNKNVIWKWTQSLTKEKIECSFSLWITFLLIEVSWIPAILIKKKRNCGWNTRTSMNQSVNFLLFSIHEFIRTLLKKSSFLLLWEDFQGPWLHENKRKRLVPGKFTMVGVYLKKRIIDDADHVNLPVPGLQAQGNTASVRLTRGHQVIHFQHSPTKRSKKWRMLTRKWMSSW